MKSNKKIARIVGVLFLAGMFIGIIGNTFVQSTLEKPDYLSTLSNNSMKLTIGALFMLLTSFWDATHGILMFPILKQTNERRALGNLSFRIIDSVFIGIQVLFVLLQLPLGSEYLNNALADNELFKSLATLLIKANNYAYQLGMIAVGLAGLLLCSTFYSARMVPSFIAIWGLVGYASLLLGSVLEVMGFNLLFVHTIPGGLWEIFIGGWLIVKGFKPSPIIAGCNNLYI